MKIRESAVDVSALAPLAIGIIVIIMGRRWWP
jgi:hypothetical protein